MTIPNNNLLGCREDMWGDTDFELRCPEYQFRGHVTSGEDFAVPEGWPLTAALRREFVPNC